MRKYLDVRIDLGAETGQDTRTSDESVLRRLTAVQDRIREVSPVAPPDTLATLLAEETALLVEAKRNREAWEKGRAAFELSVDNELWQSAARACDLLFRTGQSEALDALGQGIWLAVTFPVDPELTVALLNHVIDETPNHSDGAAVAAAVAIYVVELRARGSRYDELSIHTRQMLTTVARRHSGIESQSDLDAWVERLELNDVDLILLRLRDVVDTLVGGDWWIDRDAIRARIPDQ